jgi:hypothetical protein
MSDEIIDIYKYLGKENKILLDFMQFYIAGNRKHPKDYPLEMLFSSWQEQLESFKYIER